MPAAQATVRTPPCYSSPALGLSSGRALQCACRSHRYFGKAVGQSRFELESSQEKLPAIAAIERSHMGKFERGVHFPNLVMIFKQEKSFDHQSRDMGRPCNRFEAVKVGIREIEKPADVND